MYVYIYIYIMCLYIYIYIYIHTHRYIHIHIRCMILNSITWFRYYNESHHWVISRHIVEMTTTLNIRGGFIYISTANIYTYPPINYNTVYIMLCRHCKYLLVVVYKFMSRIRFNPIQSGSIRF